MTDDRVAELEKEIRELNLKLEIERQKTRKLEQESQKLKDKLARTARTERTVKVAAPPTSAPRTGPSAGVDDDDSFEGTATQQEIDDLRERLRTLVSRKDSSEQEKWDQSKELIEQKENLQRLRVKKINIKKDIEELNERLDRKENQNFKSRLEITDLKKEEAKTRSIADENESGRKSLEEHILRLKDQIESEKGKLRIEKAARDKIQFALNNAQKIRAEYESSFYARFYNK